MNNRMLLDAAVLCVVAALSHSSSLSSVGHAAAFGKPNILFIGVDDLNDYISPLDNHPGIITPNFDRLAKRSVTFANAHCAAPACHPSRVAMMTGVHPARSGIYRNLFGAHGPRWRHESPVLEDAVVLSQHFRNNGYRAVGGGKIFHTLQWTAGDSQNDPEAWDDYRGDPLDPISADWPRPNFGGKDQNDGFIGKRPLSKYHFGAAPLPQKDEEIGDHLVVDWAIEQMNTPQEKPLFLAVGLFRPHIPWEVPQKWFDLYPIEDVKLPEHRLDDLKDAHSHGRESWHKWVTDNDQWKHLVRGYLASISYVDNQLGRLLDALDASGLAKNTIVVLWSDHGFHIGEKENWEKFALWDQTTRVPLFIHAPGISKDGAKTRQPATLTDVYPTLCELAGLPLPSQCDGLSLVPQLKNPQAARERLALTSFTFGRVGKVASHAVADSRYRLIRYANGFEELYDLRVDPNEFVNIAAEPKFASIKARLAKGFPEMPAENRGVPVNSPYHRGRDAKAGKANATAKTQIANSSLEISASIVLKRDHPDGVLLSHGGNIHGYSIYVLEGRPRFAVRRAGNVTSIASKDSAPTGSFTLTAILKKNGMMRLLINNKQVALGNAGGAIPKTPNEDFAIGSDPLTAVGNYEPSFASSAIIKNVGIK